MHKKNIENGEIFEEVEANICVRASVEDSEDAECVACGEKCWESIDPQEVGLLPEDFSDIEFFKHKLKKELYSSKTLNDLHYSVLKEERRQAFAAKKISKHAIGRIVYIWKYRTYEAFDSIKKNSPEDKLVVEIRLEVFNKNGFIEYETIKFYPEKDNKWLHFSKKYDAIENLDFVPLRWNNYYASWRINW